MVRLWASCGSIKHCKPKYSVNIYYFTEGNSDVDTDGCFLSSTASPLIIVDYMQLNLDVYNTPLAN